MKAYICPNDLNRVYGHRSIGLPYDHYTYDSVLESTVAVLLIKANIKFIPHVSVATKGDYGEDIFVCVSFYFIGETPRLKDTEFISHGILVRWPVTQRDCYENLCMFKHKKILGMFATPKIVNNWKRKGIV